MKKNNTAEKAIRDAEKITKALKEGTEKSLRNMLNEAISNVVTESEDDEDEKNEDSYEVEDVNTEDTPMDSEETPAVDDASDDAAEGADSEGEDDADDKSDDADEDWSDEEKFKVGDDDYDLTSEDGEQVLKVFNKMGDDDQLLVKDEGNGEYSVDVEEPGEYVIKLDDNAEDAEGEDNFDFGGEEPAEDPEFDIDLGDGEGEGADDEIEIDLNGDDDENEEDEENLNEENLEYTDSYQKDVFAKKFNMSEPADSKSTYSMDAGAPDGDKKPWAGKGDPKPFEKKVDEGCGECCAKDGDCNLEEGDTVATTDVRHMKKTKMGQHRPNAPQYDVRKEDSPLTAESVAKLLAVSKQLYAENKKYKEQMASILEENKMFGEALDKVKNSLRDAATLNVNEARLINLLVNETVSRDEKVAMYESFCKVKTLAEGKMLYNEYKRKLNETKQSAPIVERQFVAESTSKLNETTFYATKENTPALDLMERMNNIGKFYKN